MFHSNKKIYTNEKKCFLDPKIGFNINQLFHSSSLPVLHCCVLVIFENKIDKPTGKLEGILRF